MKTDRRLSESGFNMGRIKDGVIGDRPGRWNRTGGCCVIDRAGMFIYRLGWLGLKSGYSFLDAVGEVNGEIGIGTDKD